MTLEHVTRTYRGCPPVAAVKPTTLCLASGDYVSLMGRSGSGKSTLLNIIGLLDRPTSGELRFRGMPTSTLSDRDLAALRGGIGFVFQSFNLLAHRTAAENVALGLLYQAVRRSRRESMARDALDRVGLSHRANALPGQMSGGEQQRVAIARAVVTRPYLVLCDEPTGSLDGASAGLVLDLLEALRSEGLAVLVVTHDLHVAARASRHLMMRDGVVSESLRTSPEMTPHRESS